MRYAHPPVAVCCTLVGMVFWASTAPAQAQTPATQPAGNDGKILLVPFTALNAPQNQQWLGRSIEQSLAADLTAVAPGRVVMSDAQTADLNAALDLGRRENAQFVVYGSFVNAGLDMRITGQVLDVGAGHAVAGLKATGRSMDIFRLEDEIALQLRHRLGLGAVPAQNPALAQERPDSYGPLSVQQAPSADQYYQDYVAQEPSPVVQNYYNSYYYGNPYANDGWGDYGYGIAGWPVWGGIVVSPGFGFRGRGHFGHGFGHGGLSHGGFGHGGFGHGGAGGHAGFGGRVGGGHR